MLTNTGDINQRFGGTASGFLRNVGICPVMLELLKLRMNLLHEAEGSRSLRNVGTPCNIGGTNQSFGGTYCLRRRINPEDQHQYKLL